MALIQLPSRYANNSMDSTIPMNFAGCHDNAAPHPFLGQLGESGFSN